MLDLESLSNEGGKEKRRKNQQQCAPHVVPLKDNVPLVKAEVEGWLWHQQHLVIESPI